MDRLWNLKGQSLRRTLSMLNDKSKSSPNTSMPKNRSLDKAHLDNSKEGNIFSPCKIVEMAVMEVVQQQTEPVPNTQLKNVQLSERPWKIAVGKLDTRTLPWFSRFKIPNTSTDNCKLQIAKKSKTKKAYRGIFQDNVSNCLSIHKANQRTSGQCLWGTCQNLAMKQTRPPFTHSARLIYI